MSPLKSLVFHKSMGIKFYKVTVLIFVLNSDFGKFTDLITRIEE
jgi:hypothetical protein